MHNKLCCDKSSNEIFCTTATGAEMLKADYYANITPVAPLLWLASVDGIIFIAVPNSIVAFADGVAEMSSGVAIDITLIILV